MGNSESSAVASKPTKTGRSRTREDPRRRKIQTKAPVESETDPETDDDSEDDPRNQPPASHAQVQQSSWYNKAKGAYDQLVHAIIRPPRSKYDMAELGPAQFTFCGKVFRRKDFVLKNMRDQKLHVSHWEPFEIERRSKELPCVIYMHGNSSCRKEAICALSLALSLGATLCGLDFSGSGKSDGEFVSLGIHEKDDLACVIQHLRDSGTVSKIALWGRSMGAATALLHGPRDSTLAAMVCDSPFSSLVSLAEGMVETGRKHGMFAPGFLVSLAIRFIRSSVQEKADFDVYSLSPADEAHKCLVPLLLVAAEGDAFIPPGQHAQVIYQHYGGPRHAIVCPGDHNSIRPKRVLDTIAVFLANALQIPDEVILGEGLHYVGQPPWVQQEQIERNHQLAFSRDAHMATPSLLDPGAVGGGGGAAHTRDIGVGMNKQQQGDTRDKLFNLLQGGAR